MGRGEGGFGGQIEDTQYTCRIRVVFLKVIFEAVEMDERNGEEAEDRALK